MPDMQDRLRLAVEEDLLASPLGTWMKEHRDEFDRMVHGRDVPWDHFALHFTRAGLLTRPDPQAVRATWEAVKRMRNARKAGRKTSPMA